MSLSEVLAARAAQREAAASSAGRPTLVILESTPVGRTVAIRVTAPPHLAHGWRQRALDEAARQGRGPWSAAVDLTSQVKP